MTPPTTSSAPAVNWASLLDQTRNDYESQGRGVVHGLQKDAIQNAWGAKDKGAWSCTFRVLKEKGKALLTITDEGTCGLIGKIIKKEDIPDEGLPATERLARFESVFYSGGNTGAGLFGRGKLLFNVISSEKTIFYDTLTKDGKYRFNKRKVHGGKYEQYDPILEGQAAKERLAEDLGGVLTPLAKAGTRIIIVNPLPEVLAAIEDGSFMGAIEETWWEIVQKYKADIRVINAKGVESKANVPQDFADFPQKSGKGWNIRLKENLTVVVGEETVRIKRLHLLVPPEGKEAREGLQGVQVHRRGMQVGPLSLSGIPDELSGRLVGFVQLDEPFEDLLAPAENTTHYGFTTRHSKAYKALRDVAQNELDELLREMGIKKKKDDPNDKAKRSADEAQQELNALLHQLGVPNFGTGPEKNVGLLLSVEDLDFPGDSNRLTMGDSVAGFRFKVENASATFRTCKLTVETRERDGTPIETLLQPTKLELSAWDSKLSKMLEFTIGEDYPTEAKVACTARLLDDDGEEIARKSFYVYVDLDAETPDEWAKIRLVSQNWPRQSSRRVNYGESIKDLSYRIENCSPHKMKLKFKVRTLGPDKTAIDEHVAEHDMVLLPSQEQVVPSVTVTVTKPAYEEVGKGKVFVRAQAVALEETKDWPKSQKLAVHTLPFFLNIDPAYGVFEDWKTPDLGKDGPRSAVVQGSGPNRYVLEINIGHPAYGHAVEDGRGTEYQFEEAVRQTAYVLIKGGHEGVMRKVVGDAEGSPAGELSPDEVVRDLAYKFTDRILSRYYSEA